MVGTPWRMMVLVTGCTRICAESGTCLMQTTMCMRFSKAWLTWRTASVVPTPPATKPDVNTGTYPSDGIGWIRSGQQSRQRRCNTRRKRDRGTLTGIMVAGDDCESNDAEGFDAQPSFWC